MSAVRPASLSRRRSALSDLLLELLSAAAGPVSAYGLLRAVQLRSGKPVAPTSVYRALGCLIARGRVTRINALGAYVLSFHPDESGCVFFVCRRCRRAAEVEDRQMATLLAADADSLGFAVARPVVEVEGVCRSCRLVADTASQ